MFGISENHIQNQSFVRDMDHLLAERYTSDQILDLTNHSSIFPNSHGNTDITVTFISENVSLELFSPIDN